MQESTIAIFARNFFPVTKDIIHIVDQLEQVKNVMENTFEMIYTRCYFNDDTKQFDHAELQLDIEKQIIRAEVKQDTTMGS